ncbi:MAG: putative transrane protein [Myxococcaceae bacterium]|nr:putative transrane protein [Myxococcaceae bacterium]
MRTASRCLWSAVGATALAVLAVARWLAPSASGLGTHVALGLPPCGFLLWTGLPCPACGLTTSFAQLARGQLLLALAANPLGLPLFALMLVLPGLALQQVLSGRSPMEAIDRFAADRVALLLVLALLLSWSARLLALCLHGSL